MNPFYCNYTKAVLLSACQSLELDVSSSNNKEQLINALCRVDDQTEAHAAVRAAAGE